MIYLVIEVRDSYVVLWDQISTLDKHPDQPGGLITVYVGSDNPFNENDKVLLTVRKVDD